MKKVIAGMVIMTICIMTLTSCANTIPELDEQSKDLVVEYAAATVRKYNDYQPGKFLDESDLTEQEDEIDEELSEPAKEEVVETQEQENSSNLETDEEVPVIEKEEEAFVPTTINDFLELQGAHITYEGYEVKDSYPDAGEELFFVMEASKGNKLLLLKFVVQNDSDEDCSLDFVNKDIRYKIAVNGKTKNALTTMLPDDLRNYQGVLGSGEKETLVLVREISKEQADTINELALALKSGDQNATISLN